MMSNEKPLVWLHGEVKSPPLSRAARVEAGYLLRLLQQGFSLTMPQSKPMPSIGNQCHELRIQDENGIWRIVYSIEPDAIVLLDVFQKKTPKTPRRIVQNCRKRLKEYFDE